MSQIPPDLVVKCQAIDIVEVIFSLIWRGNIVQTSWRNRKSRCELLSPSEAHRSTTKSGGMWKFRLPPSLGRDIPGRWGGNIGAVWGPVCDNVRGRTLQEWVRVMLDTPGLLLGAWAGLQEVPPPRGRTV